MAIILLILMPTSIWSVKTDKHVQNLQRVEGFEQEMKWQIKYNKVIEYIKAHEGFSPVKYVCAAGVPTIGYGHVIFPNENQPDYINESQADDILRQDFEKALKYVSFSMPELNGNKKLALAHFVFSLGVGRFNKSSLKKSITENQNIDSVWLSYCYFTTVKSKKIRSEYAYEIRKWELELFNSDN